MDFALCASSYDSFVYAYRVLFLTGFFIGKDTIAFTVATVMTSRERMLKEAPHRERASIVMPTLALSFFSLYGQVRNKFDEISIKKLFSRNRYQKNLNEHKMKTICILYEILMSMVPYNKKKKSY